MSWSFMSKARPRTTALAAGVAAFGLVLAGCGGGEGDDASGEETYELTFASWATPGSSNEAVQDRWMEMIDEATDGRITFEVSMAGSLCDSDEIPDRKSTRLNSSHVATSYAVSCLKKNR